MTFGILISFLNAPCLPTHSGSYGIFGACVNYSGVYSGFPFIIVGLIILVWSFISKENKTYAELTKVDTEKNGSELTTT